MQYFKSLHSDICKNDEFVQQCHYLLIWEGCRNFFKL